MSMYNDSALWVQGEIGSFKLGDNCEFDSDSKLSSEAEENIPQGGLNYVRWAKTSINLNYAE